jgi:osmotically inducible lipoprotein OsmB
MKQTTPVLAGLSTVLLVGTLFLGGCAGMTSQEKGTATGAVLGGVAGNVLCGGGVLCTGAGAAVGGVLGHEVAKPK